MSDRPKMLLILGGLRVGDTFHAIPFLKKACETHDITWIHGSYEAEAVDVIANVLNEIQIEERIVMDDGMPTDLNSITTFRDCASKQHQNIFHRFQVIETSADIITSANPAFTLDGAVKTNFVVANRRTDSWVTVKDSEKYRQEYGDYIAVQPATCSTWKIINSVYEAKFPLKTLSMGKPGERLIDGAIDTRSWGLVEAARVLAGARLIVAQHSALGVLGFYLNKPTIIIHFFMEGLFEFSRFHANCRDLKQPSKGDLEDAVDMMLKEYPYPGFCTLTEKISVEDVLR